MTVMWAIIQNSGIENYMVLHILVEHEIILEM